MMDPNDETQPSSTAVAREAAAIRDAIDQMADARHKFPERIGPHRIIREIGRGGMGRVLLGVRDDDQFRRQVAIKLLRTTMADDEARRRFEVERQVLSNLTHPNIARLFEGGELEDGTPYLVMEYVEGQSIDDYCDAQRLPLAQRLALFQKVCGAIHFAHTQLVVHRDIKPSNILVTPAGEPKLVDFGIAKLRNPNIVPITVDTTPQLRLMTPEYASPEQVQGQPIGTTSDVYSLGVLLYELVCGRRPYDFKTREHAEIQHVVCDVDPARPSDVVTRPVERRRSDGTTQTVTADEIARRRETRPDTLRRRVRGDLERIILKAMQKVARHRYDSAAKFGEDVQNYLTGMPVVARAPSSWYRCVKFARRNRYALGAVTAVVCALAIGLGVAAQQRAEAMHQRDVARVERARATGLYEDALASLEEFIGGTERQLRNLSGSVVARQRLAELSAAIVEQLRTRAAHDDPRFDRLAALALLQQGDLHGAMGGGGDGDHATAAAAYARAEAILQRICAAAPQDNDLSALQCRAAWKHGDALQRLGRMQEAEQAWIRASRRAETLREDSRVGRSARRVLASVLSSLAEEESKAAEREKEAARTGHLEEASTESGHLEEAVRLSTKSVAEREALLASAPPEELAESRRDLSVGLIDLAEARFRSGKSELALQSVERALQLRKLVADAAGPDAAIAKRDLAVAQEKALPLLVEAAKEAGLPALVNANRERRVRQIATESFEAVSQLRDDDPADTRARDDYVRIGCRSADALREIGDRDVARARFEVVIAAASRWLSAGLDDANLRYQTGVAEVLYGEMLLRDAQSSEADLAKADRLLESARSRFERLKREGPASFWDAADQNLKRIDEVRKPDSE